MTAPFTPTLSVIDAAEALARKADAWPGMVAQAEAEAAAWERARVAKQQGFWARRDAARQQEGL